jgi:MoaA/NifB/PqqE/SkfB family radical SAM enzyme
MALGLDLWRIGATHRLHRIPVVTLMPHSRCNCRCVMCDIWKANQNGTSFDPAALDSLVEDFARLRVGRVVLSGGEALLHPNLWRLCSALKTLPLRITLLSSGLLLARHAEGITQYCDDVIVSLDGPEEIHNRVRGVRNAFGALAEGVAALRRISPHFPVDGRCVIQRANFRDLAATIDGARRIGLDHISFLPADTASTAFNRAEPWDTERAGEIALTVEESTEFAGLVETLIATRASDFAEGFIRETQDRMRRVAQRFLARNGLAPTPAVQCNAPWVSAVIEADGTVRPCFFHPPMGNIHDDGLAEILNSPDALTFRKGLDVRHDPVCRDCVCTLRL